MSEIDSEKVRRRSSVLPPSLPPRGLSRAAAAEYIGISTSLFDALVAEQKMPGPKKLRGRLVWDRKQLDCCFDALDDDGQNPWD